MSNARYHLLCAELFKRGNFSKQVTTPWGKHEKQEQALDLLSRNEITQIGYGGSARCFTGETLVQTISGHKRIDSIKEGEYVLSLNLESKKREYKKVLKTFRFNNAEPPKIAIFSNGLKCTHDHEFLFKGKWTKASELGKRALEKSRRQLFCFKQRQVGYIKSQGVRKTKINEASVGRVRLFKNKYFNKREKHNGKNTSFSGSSFYTKHTKQTSSKPYRFCKDKQLCREFRMGYGSRKLYSFSEGRQIQYVQERRKTASKLPKNRGRQRYINFNRTRRKGDKEQIQTTFLYTENVSGRIWGKTCNNKRCCVKKELESREIKEEEIKGVKFKCLNVPIYDLHVEDNNNYTVTKNNIIVHNSGKSWIASEYLLMMCLAYPETGWGLARKELKNLKRTTLRTFFKVLNKYRLKLGIDYKYNQQDHIISFSNGSEIFLIDTAYAPSDPLYLRFGGYELTGIVIDESNETDHKAIEILFGRCGFRKNIDYGISPKMLEMFNPDKGHVYKRYYQPYKKNQERNNRKFVPALPSDNPDPAVKIWIEEQINNSSIITIERLVKGNFDYDDSLDRLVEYVASLDLFTNDFVEKGRKYITADIARLGKDSSVIRLWEGLHSTKRIEIKKTKVTETAKYIKDLTVKEKVPMSRVICDEDGVGGGVVDILNCYGFVANRKPIGKTNYANLKAQCHYIMAKLINERKVCIKEDDQSIIDKIIEEIDWVKEKDIDKDGKLNVVPKEIVSKNLGRSPDDWDAIAMRAYFELSSGF